jgi:hypothetical protein
MYMFINALILALLVPAAGVERVADGPACRAELKGLDLVTTLEFPSGLQVDGPWRVVHTADKEDDKIHYVMFATLDRMVQRDPATGARNIVPFPQPISLAFEGATQKELVQHAARVWCVTVMRAQENQRLDRLSPTQAVHTRVAVLPHAKPVS